MSRDSLWYIPDHHFENSVRHIFSHFRKPRSPFFFVTCVCFLVIMPEVLAHNSRLIRKAGGSLSYETRGCQRCRFSS